MSARYFVGGNASPNWNATAPTNWATTSGGANNASVPTVADDVFLDAASPANTVSAGQSIKSLTCNGFTQTFTHNAGVTLTVVVGGAVTFAATMTVAIGSPTTSTLTCGGQLTTNGKVLGRVRTLDNATLTLMDDLSCGSLLNTGFAAATFTATTQNVTVSGAVQLGTRTTHLGSGTWTVGSWSTSSIGGAVFVETATVVLNVTGPTFFNSPENYNTVTFTGPDVGPVDMTVGVIATLIVNSPPKTLNIDSGLTVGTFICHGLPGNLMTLQSQLPGSPWVFSVDAADVSYTAVQDSAAVGAGAPVADTEGGVDNGGNTGWNFIFNPAFVPTTHVIS